MQKEQQTTPNAHLCVRDVWMKLRRGQQFIKTAGEKETEGEMKAGRVICQGQNTSRGIKMKVSRQDFLQSMRPLISTFFLNFFSGGAEDKKREGESRQKE